MIQTGSKASLMLRRHYESCLKAHGPTAKALEWRRPGQLRMRFEVMLRVLESTRQPFSILDVGCGFGLLLQHIIRRRLPLKRYVGVEISPDIIAVARRRFPGAEFICGDICDPSVALPMCDYVVTNGMFNLKQSISTKAMDSFFEAATRRMHGQAKKAIAFNVMTSHVNYRDPNLYYRDPGETLAYCVRSLSRFVRISHDYPLYEYFTFVYKQRRMEQ